MKFLEFQEQFYDKVNSRTAIYLSALKHEFEKANKEAQKKIAEFYDAFTLADAKNMYQWSVSSGYYFKLKDGLHKIYTDACIEAYKIISNCLRSVLCSSYAMCTYAHRQLHPDIECVALPKELINVIINGDTKSIVYYNTVQGQTMDIFGDINTWLPRHNAVSVSFNKSRDKQWRLIETAISRYLLGNRKYERLLTRIATCIGLVNDNSLTGMLACSARILKTESVRCMSAGPLAAAYAMYGRYNTDVTKMWHSLSSVNKREYVQQMEGMETHLNGLFTYPDGKTKSPYPGMSGRPFYDVNNCCVIIIKPDKDIDSDYTWNKFIE